ncbi:MAG: Lycopene elongase, partial [uncultured Rubrobacteraceae bacterium]
DQAPHPHIAAGALDQHRRTRDGRNVARRQPVALGGAAGTALAHAAFQPPDLRRQRCLRSGNGRQEPPQGHARRRPYRPRRVVPHSPRGRAAEPPVSVVLRSGFAGRGDAVDGTLRPDLRRLLSPTGSFQGPPLPGLPEQRRLRLPAGLCAAGTRRDAPMARRRGSHGVERGQAHLRRRAGRGRGPCGGHPDHGRQARSLGRRFVERLPVDARDRVLRPRERARGPRKRRHRRLPAIRPAQQPHPPDGASALPPVHSLPLCRRNRGRRANRGRPVLGGLPL